MCMEHFRWAKEVLMSPRKSTKKDLKYGEFMKRLVVMSLVSGVLSTVITAAAFMTELAVETEALTWASVFVMVPMYIVSAIIGPFVGGAINHFFGRYVFRFFKGDYKKTYNAAAYSMVPRLLFAWIPFLGGLIAGIWGIVVGVHALMNQQKISMGKALIITFVPMIIALAVAVAAVLIVGEGFGDSDVVSVLESV